MAIAIGERIPDVKLKTVTEEGVRDVSTAELFRGKKAVLFGVPLLRWIVSACNKQSNQNWHGLGESDCLIKTKHCDGRQAVLTQCDFCPVL